ncbi:MAG: CYTH and CHAD domain-containing protein [Vitreoscilla sp.]|nr:CYTH and CHAD domain-containing protein [Vitreoscilla sp.]
MHEFELKFQVDPDRAAAVRAAIRRAAPRRQHLRAIYFDTPDAALARAGMALRLRREGRHWVQTLKAAGEHTAIRLEDNQPLPGAAEPTLQPDRHAASAVGQRLLAVLAASGGTLVALYGTDIQRQTVKVEHGGALIEIAFDEGEIHAGEARWPVCEVEYELVSGPAAPLFDLAREGVQAHGLWLDTVSKAERGMRLARGQRHGSAVKARSPVLQAGDGGGAMLRSTLAACAEQVLGNAAALAAGSPDAEHLHQLRVGVRRLRCASADLATWCPQAVPADLPVLVQLFRDLGASRDDEALASGVRPWLEAAGVPAVVGPPAAASTADPGDRVRAAAVQTALLGLLECVAADAHRAGADGLAAAAAQVYLRQRLGSLRAQVLRDADRFPQLPEARQHRVRKRVKRLRYLVEFASALFPRRAVERFLKALAVAQQRLGEHQDGQMATARYRIAGEHDPRAAFAAGWLLAHQAETARACRQALKRLKAAEPFW